SSAWFSPAATASPSNRSSSLAFPGFTPCCSSGEIQFYEPVINLPEPLEDLVVNFTQFNPTSFKFSQMVAKRLTFPHFVNGLLVFHATFFLNFCGLYRLGFNPASSSGFFWRVLS